MKPINHIYVGSPPGPDDQPLTRCPQCQRLNTQDDYRPDGECPLCQASYKPTDLED